MEIYFRSINNRGRDKIEKTGTHDQKESGKVQFLMDQAESCNSGKEINAVHCDAYRLFKQEKYRSVQGHDTGNQQCNEISYPDSPVQCKRMILRNPVIQYAADSFHDL
jgi:hypothetical protein